MSRGIGLPPLAISLPRGSYTAMSASKARENRSMVASTVRLSMSGGMSAATNRARWLCQPDSSSPCPSHTNAALATATAARLASSVR
ncbi:hypothetical protein Q1M63_12395 (plasmid) [Sinorhizobium meliloti]|nr:hypothetical protein Q1M63_12395 [Sinorhizobium meliloti]